MRQGSIVLRNRMFAREMQKVVRWFHARRGCITWISMCGRPDMHKYRGCWMIKRPYCNLFFHRTFAYCETPLGCIAKHVSKSLSPHRTTRAQSSMLGDELEKSLEASPQQTCVCVRAKQHLSWLLVRKSRRSQAFAVVLIVGTRGIKVPKAVAARTPFL